MKKLLETILSEAMNVLKKQGYSTNEPGSKSAAEQGLGMFGGGGQGGGRGRGCGGGGGRGSGKGGGGCGGGGK